MQQCIQPEETPNDINGNFQQDHSITPSIIIIGAGAAGIAAATRLLDNGFTNLTILEAENRVGGRIFTTQLENFTVDLGAQFCHGEEGNVIYEMVKDLNLLESELGKARYTPYHSSRKKLDRRLFNELFEQFEEFFYEEKGINKCSFGEYMIRRTAEKYENDEVMYATAVEALNTYRLDLLANEGPFTWFDLAADEDYEECDGNKLLGWKGSGFKTILDVLTRHYPNPAQELPLSEQIVLKQYVSKILWCDKKVTVYCGDGLYIADHVIFTPSLGVLKKHYSTLFYPKLPQEKVRAISTIGIGSVVKIIYHFPVIWWPKGSRDFTFVWSEVDRANVTLEFPEAVKNGKSWLLDVLQLIRIANSPNLLGAWICGETVRDVELLPEDKIINGTMFLINKFLGHLFSGISRPDRIIRESWYANPHFRGTYSYQTMKSRAVPGASQEVVLGQPLMCDGVPRLLFAGEATSPTHYGTVHGAIETGWREADRIIQLYKE